ncbi:MAG TPA: SDR family NAD(P)-dependent oxidoreductase [Ktedonosporobacter sp.]|nr:SDR family NAD(P)-dependent oxidoreductase [Ktedonosporobacter sp.]
MAPTDMQGKICLVTGSTSGIGKATAFALAQQHATVILGCRDRKRGEAVMGEIKAENPEASVDLLLMDLSVQQSVRSAVTEFENRYDHLDVLINNAAVFKQERVLTADSYETMFATNHLGPFLLTNLLLPRLKASPAARILNITPPSAAKIPFQDLQAEQKFSALPVFSVSKSCQLIFSYDLAHRLDGSNVTVNAFYPGLVKTPLMKEAPAPMRWVLSLLTHSPEPVAQSVVYYASSPEVQGMTGKLFNKSRQSIDPGPSAKDRAVQQQLWEASLALAPLDEGTPAEKIHSEKIQAE